MRRRFAKLRIKVNYKLVWVGRYCLPGYFRGGYLFFRYYSFSRVFCTLSYLVSLARRNACVLPSHLQDPRDSSKRHPEGEPCIRNGCVCCFRYELLFPPVDIQHTQCPCRCLILCTSSSVATNLDRKYSS